MAGGATGRTISFHPPTLEHLRAAFETLWLWLVPVGLDGDWVLLLAAAAFTLAAFVLLKSSKEQRTRQSLATLPSLLFLFVINYGVVMILTVSLVDAQTPFDDRIFSPLYLCVLVLGAHRFSDLSRFPVSMNVARLCQGAILCLFLVAQLGRSTRWLEQSYHSGVGYAGTRWKESRLIKDIASLDSHIPIFTNAPDAVYTLTGKIVSMIPRRINTGTGEVRSAYEDELVWMKGELAAKRGVLVYFNTVPWRSYLPSKEELRTKLGLHPVITELDGSIYRE